MKWLGQRRGVSGQRRRKCRPADRRKHGETRERRETHRCLLRVPPAIVAAPDGAFHGAGAHRRSDGSLRGLDGRGRRATRKRRSGVNCRGPLERIGGEEGRRPRLDDRCGLAVRELRAATAPASTRPLGAWRPPRVPARRSPAFRARRTSAPIVSTSVTRRPLDHHVRRGHVSVREPLRVHRSKRIGDGNTNQHALPHVERPCGSNLGKRRPWRNGHARRPPRRRACATPSPARVPPRSARVPSRARRREPWRSSAGRRRDRARVQGVPSRFQGCRARGPYKRLSTVSPRSTLATAPMNACPGRSSCLV